jgi:hypothetical protein
MKLSKEKLLSLINENLKEMAMDFETDDRPDKGVEDKLKQGETPFKKVPLPKTGDEPNKNFQEVLGSERYKQLISTLRRYVPNAPTLDGMNGVMSLQHLLMNAHNTIVRSELNHREELERLAVEVVMKEMGIPEGSVEFDAKIVGMGEVTTDDFNRDGNDEEENSDEVDIDSEDLDLGVEISLYNDLQSLDVEKAKRRLINSLIQGASNKGHYMYHLVPDRIGEITGNPNLIDMYGIMMSINDLNYWQLSDETIKQMGGDSGAGKEQVERPEDEDGVAKIIARGINFPVLVHELIKGVLELFAIQGRPEDEETYDEVESSEDTLEKEMWDLRLGPAIWDRLRNQFPDEILIDENKKELQNYLLVEIFKLPAKKFLVFMREVLQGTDKGKRLMNELMDGINKMFNDQEYEDAVSVFRSDLEDITDETEGSDINSFLNSLGISGNLEPDDEDDDEDEDGPFQTR